MRFNNFSIKLILKIKAKNGTYYRINIYNLYECCNRTDLWSFA